MAPLLKFLRHLFSESRDYVSIATQLNDVGIRLANSGMLDEAIINFSNAIKICPDIASSWSNLGNALMSDGKEEEACKCFEKGSVLKDVPAELFDNWGTALYALGRLAESVVAHKKAIGIDPSFSSAIANLGNAYRAMGRLDDAMMNLNAAQNMSPNDRITASARLYTMNHLTGMSVEDIADAHTAWPAPPLGADVSFDNAANPQKKLNVGYVSGDFRFHSCAHFMLPLIEAHDRDVINVHAFSHGRISDDITEAFMRSVDCWTDIRPLSDQAFVAEVREREIDILVDCSGHTTDSRLAAFALRAAPVQVSWLGYPNTTGLRQMDARLTDQVATPKSMEPLFVEKSICLGGGHHTFRLLRDQLPAQKAPRESQEMCTFGAFHNVAKISDECLSLWAGLLQEVPSSRLIIKCKSFLDSDVIASVRNRCVCVGMESHRVEFLPWKPDAGTHLLDLNEIDIFLDTHPYNGTTSVCEALWMGVPVVTMPVDRPAGRVCASLLTSAGFPEWIAESEEQYVRIAAALAANPKHLTDLRTSMRKKLERTPLGNAEQFARSVEKAYRSLWQSWCSQTAH